MIVDSLFVYNIIMLLLLATKKAAKNTPQQTTNRIPDFVIRIDRKSIGNDFGRVYS